MKENGERILYADVLRIITTFIVILFHVSTERWYSFGDKFDWNIINIVVSGVRWAAPLFFMLSGLTFLNPQKKIPTSKIFTKYIPHMVIALLFWSLIYKTSAAIYNYVNLGKPLDIAKILNPIIFETSWMHMWFLYTLVGLYILTPPLRVFTANASKNSFIYLLVIYFVYTAVWDSISGYTGLTITLFKLPDLVGYTGYFIMGYFLSIVRYSLFCSKQLLFHIK